MGDGEHRAEGATQQLEAISDPPPATDFRSRRCAIAWDRHASARLLLLTARATPLQDGSSASPVDALIGRRGPVDWIRPSVMLGPRDVAEARRHFTQGGDSC
jgi:hypothetical protein